MPAPPTLQPQVLADYLDALTNAVFKAGMTARVVDAKWPGMRAALGEFAPEHVATLTPEDLDLLATDPRVIRNRRKLAATVENATRMRALASGHGGFDRWLAAQGDFAATAAALQREFRFVGDATAFNFLVAVGAPAPSVDDWLAAREGR